MKKSVIAFIVFVFILFVLVIIFAQHFNENKLLNIESEINLKATETYHYKGFVTVNDSVTISENTSRIVNDSSLYIVRYKYFGSLEAPFKIYKKQNNDTIVVIKGYETLYYKLND